MSKKGINRFRQKERYLHFRICYIIITEGTTEEHYFRMFKKQRLENIEIICKKSKHPSVEYLINTMNSAVDSEAFNKYAECWIVLDNDVLSAADIKKLRAWIADKTASVRRFVGISSPEFEYWLLLHFEIPSSQLSASICTQRLKKHIPYYKKPFQNCLVLSDRIESACKNATQKEIRLGEKKNGTNLHHLVNKLKRSGNE